jgi:PAS domain S-box-containing protein
MAKYSKILDAGQNPLKDLKRLESVLHSARIGIWDWYLQSNDVIFNDDWKAMVGFEMNELEDNITTWEKLIHPDDREETYKVLNEHLLGKTPYYESAHRLLHKNGNYIWILDTGQIVERDIEGNAVRATGIHKDITSLKELQLSLEKANASKDLFMADISHEFKNMLNGILLPVQILQQNEIDFEKLDLLKIISSSGELLSSIITDILDYNKMNQHSMTLNIRKTDLITLIEESIFILRENANDNHIDIILETDLKKPFMIHTDSSRLKQVFINILSNAIKYNKEHGYVKIILLQDKNFFKITFIDNGIGMSPEYLKNIFKPFERDLSNVNHIHGHGLGLSIVKKIITLMKGDIEIWSRLNVGTNILITLPTDITPVNTTTTNTTTTNTTTTNTLTNTTMNPKDEPKIMKKGLRIILADDNANHLMMVRNILQSHECIVIEAIDGSQLLEKASKNDYDLIITDISMPKITGDEVVKILRSKNNNKPIIAITGNVFKDDIEKYLETGINEIISKPYKIKTLIETINSLIKN